MSKAKDIAQRITERLSSIRSAAGYQTDAGLNVFRGRKAVPELPALILFEPEDLVEGQAADGSGSHAGSAVNAQILLPFDIQALAECDPAQHMTTGHALVADIKRALFGGDMRWGGLATHTRYIGRSIEPRTDGDTTVSVMVQIRVGVVEDLARP